MADKNPQRRGELKRREPGKGDLVPGSLASLETTLPPTPLKKLLAADGASVYVYSNDEALVETVEEAGGDQYPVHTADDWAELMSVVDSGLCYIVLLDADALSENLEKQIADLHGVQPSLVILLAAPREAAQKHIDLLSDRRIHRLLIKPATVGITRLLLESAVGRFLQLREQLQATSEDRIGRLHRRPAPAERTRWPAWVLAVALVSLLVAALLAGGVLQVDFRSLMPASLSGDASDGAASTPEGAVAELPTETVVNDPVANVGEPAVTVADPEATASDTAATGETSPSSETAAETAPVAASEATADTSARDATASDTSAPGATSSVTTASDITRSDAAPGAAGDEPAAASTATPPPDPFAVRLERAEAAAAAGDIARPIGASALDLYAAIVAEAPEHVEANERLASIVDSLFAEAEAALLAGDIDAAGTALAHVRRVQPDSSRLMFLENQVARAREEAAAAAAQPPSEFESLLGIAATRIERGVLVEPADDSAELYLERAAALAPNDPRLLELRGVFAANAVDRARLVLNAGDLETAAALADTAFEFGADTEALAVFELDLVAAREQEAEAERGRLLDLGRARLSEGRLIAPAGDSAFDHLSAVRAERPNFPGLAAPWNTLMMAIADQARAAIDESRWPGAEAYIAALATDDARAEEAARLDQTLNVTRRRENYLSSVAPASELELLEYSPPRYPVRALRRNVEGWVDLEFVVDEFGQPTEITVVASEPEDTFVEAALEALEEYVYRPFTLDGDVYERRVQLRIRFELE